MTETSGRALQALNQLYRIVEAGEKGFATAAAGTSNQGLKLLFKSYAQQRFQFKEEILNLIRASGGAEPAGGSLPGMVHRGRVAIFAAMTIEDDRREQVVLKEAALGERYAVQTYQKTLEEDLPQEARRVLERQLAEVREARETIAQMRGEKQRRVVRLFQSEPEAEHAGEALEQAGFPIDSIETLPLDQSAAFYQGRGATVIETALSGAVGGAFWGTIIGVLAGLGAERTSALAWLGIDPGLATVVVVALMTIAMGALVGGLLGLTIGLATSEEDTYDVSQRAYGRAVLLSSTVEPERAVEAGRIMDQARLQFQEASPNART